MLAVCKLFSCFASLWGAVLSDLDFISYDYSWANNDRVNPELIDTTPQNLSQDVSVDVSLHFVFSEPVIAGLGGRVDLEALGDVRSFVSSDAQVVLQTQGVNGNRTMVVRPVEPLRPGLEYRVTLSHDFVQDMSGNKYQGGLLIFRTAGAPPEFVVFAPYVQAPSSPLVVAFRTKEHVLYGSPGDSYRVELWPEDTSLFQDHSINSSCTSVPELAEDFPALESCVGLNGRFVLSLRAQLQSNKEYSLVVRWPTAALVTNVTEVYWNLATARIYRGTWVEVERFDPWRHQFQDFLANSVNGTLASLQSLRVPLASPDALGAEWLGPQSIREFRIELSFGGLGVPAKSRLRLIASPILDWSTDPSQPVNVSLLEALRSTDPAQLSSGPWRQAASCPHFFPTRWPSATSCRLLKLGRGGPAFGIELRLQAYDSILAGVQKSFALSLPGVRQPLAMAARWEAILFQQRGPSTVTHSPMKVSENCMLLDTSAGTSLSVLSSSYPYAAPLGARLTRVEVELRTCVFAPPGQGAVVIDLLEPTSARIETCEPVEGLPRLGEVAPEVTTPGGEFSRVRWLLEPPSGTGSFIAYPRTRYRLSCLIYNGPIPVSYSRWRLGVEVQVANETFSFASNLTSTNYLVSVPLAAAQIVPTLPLLGRWQTIFVRVVLPVRDGVSLIHWTSGAWRLLMTAPLGYELPEGSCPGFFPLTESALPPLPLSSCMGVDPKPHALEIVIDRREPGFEPGQTYAFRVTVKNPGVDHFAGKSDSGLTTEEKQGQITDDNSWSLKVLGEPDGQVVTLLENVPAALTGTTAALRPEEASQLHDSSFRLCRQPLVVVGITADDPRLGAITIVVLEFQASTPLRNGDLLLVTAPSAFAWVEPVKLNTKLFSQASGLGTQPFPGREPQVLSGVPYMLRVTVNKGLQARRTYGLAVNITNPSAAQWGAIDAGMNYWLLETFFGFSSIMAAENRRDSGVRQGYSLLGSLHHCSFVPVSRLRGVETWITVTFQLSEPLAAHSFRQPSLPSQLHLQLPKGYYFPATVPAALAALERTFGNCSGLLEPDASQDSPQLRVAQFPHPYLPLPDISSFTCSLDGAADVARTLTVELATQYTIALMPHRLYAFRLRVVSALYDRIRDTRWVLQSRNRDGETREICYAEGWPGADALPLATSRLPDITQAVLPTGVATLSFAFAAGSLALLPELNATSGAVLVQMQVQAPSGYAFLRDCTASWEPPAPYSAWELLSCEGHMAVASLSLLNKQEVPVNGSMIAEQLTLTVRARAPSRLKVPPLVPASWSVTRFLQNGSSFEAVVIQNLSMREMSEVRLQPLSSQVFRADPSLQTAVLSVRLSSDMNAGAFLEVASPRYSTFVFDWADPCPFLTEDPVLLASVKQASTGMTAGASSACYQECVWPSILNCKVTHSGTRLTFQLADTLQAGSSYCFELRAFVPGAEAIPELPIHVLSQTALDGRVMDLAPLVMSDHGQGWGVAPFVRRLARLSLCYTSRIPTSAAVELSVQVMPSSLSLGTAGQDALVGLFCPAGAAVTGGSCRLLEPVDAVASCSLLTKKIGCAVDGSATTCLALQGTGVWAPFRRVVLSIGVELTPGAVPSIDFQLLLGSGEGLLMQGDKASSTLPMLLRLPSVSFSAPRAATTADAFVVSIQFDWQGVAVSVVGALAAQPWGVPQTPAVLDISVPSGMTISSPASCSPVNCMTVAPNADFPQPVIRLFLRDATALQPWDLPTRRIQQQGQVGLFAGLPRQLFIVLNAAKPLMPDQQGNSWGLVLRSDQLQALGVLGFPGFGVAAPVLINVAATSNRARDQFSRFVLRLEFVAPLSPGDIVMVTTPASDVVCRASLVEPAVLFGTTTAVTPQQPPNACVFEVRQQLYAGVLYVISVPLENPVLTPQPNLWLVQAFSHSPTAAGDWLAHSIGESSGYEVFGEFESFQVLSHSAVPHVATPALVQFKLRTPFSEENATGPGPGILEPMVRLQLTVTGAAAVAPGSASEASFDPGKCLIDMLRFPTPLPPIPAADEALHPFDCLVSDGGKVAEFFFDKLLDAGRIYYFWAWLRNPSIQAAADPEWTIAATTILRGGRLSHQSAYRPADLRGLRATVVPASYALGASHRAMIVVTAGRPIMGQRGSIEVVLPPGFSADCGPNFFRPRPALPSTARCRNFEAGDGPGGQARLVVFWRSIFGADSLSPPYEFGFQLTNPNTSMSAGVASNWTVTLYEGENQEFAVDVSSEGSIQAFQTCEPMAGLSLRREDAQVVSVMFRPGQDLPAGFANVLRAELRSSAAAPAELRCPETSIWRRRPGLEGHMALMAKGLPQYTQCVEEPQKALSNYFSSARQHSSAALFLLPFAQFYGLAGDEPFGLEVIVKRAKLGTASLEPSESESAAELINVHLEDGNGRARCASVPLGPVPVYADYAVAAEEATITVDDSLTVNTTDVILEPVLVPGTGSSSEPVEGATVGFQVPEVPASSPGTVTG
ncbi:unnamed protein product [Polarella glacialis]|uniref:SbsA Ig-like domain-containing protein n=2 Tax=Polarella glacialis TaxID=89957 RepID=A0A813J895_POLGL|nr:unnamed protein product [Polarella glacialis]